MTAYPWFVLVESNTTGSGRRFCAVARTRGLRPVVLAADPGRYPYLTGDGVDHLTVDTGDQDAVDGACARLARDGVAGVTSSSEYFIAAAAAAAAGLGLPGPSATAVRDCRAKDRQRALLVAGGVAVPAFRVVDGAAGAADAAAALGLPVVVKPVAGSGSTGVRLCATAAETADAVAGLLAGADERGTPRERRVLVEEYARGPEYSVETIGDAVVGVTRKHLGPAPFFVETGHDFPAPLAEAERTAVERTTLRALHALGLGWGAAHTELRVTPRGPVLIEVNPRLAGGMITAVVEEATGIDLVACCVDLACGRPPSLAPARAAAASIRFLVAERAGAVTAVRGIPAAQRMPGVRAVAVTVEPGTRIGELTQSFRDRLGHVITTAGDVARAASVAESARAAIVVEQSPSAAG
ncbi:ATP-grasp domain-containing protein [Amycolatopsis sp. NPDC026612]|uniref:ATP-grasp domain-containing protein n=1 Tax=Amycolatopsis sp. NPDC026612 TaxID=3155466 RepID=UPI003410BB54